MNGAFAAVRSALWLRRTVVCCGMGSCIAVPIYSQGLQAAQEPSVRRSQDVSLDDYRKHLLALQSLTVACARARDLKTCDPLLVGPDDRIPLDKSTHPERRMIRYGWLRILFSRAEEPDPPPPPQQKTHQGSASEKAQPDTARTTSQLLQDAQIRLAHDVAQSEISIAASASHSQEHAALRQVLAGREFRNLKPASAGDSALEKFGGWINKLFEGLGRLRARSAWLGRAITWTFLLSVGAVLVGLLLRWERRWRRRAAPDQQPEVAPATAALHWQLWLDDARKAAAEGQWRDAIHLLYWAAIAKLEAKRILPADLARTPREYLRLFASDDLRRNDLVALTNVFERTWYGARRTDETTYREAEQLVSSIIASRLSGDFSAPNERGAP